MNDGYSHEWISFEVTVHEYIYANAHPNTNLVHLIRQALFQFRIANSNLLHTYIPNDVASPQWEILLIESINWYLCMYCSHSHMSSIVILPF